MFFRNAYTRILYREPALRKGNGNRPALLVVAYSVSQKVAENLAHSFVTAENFNSVVYIFGYGKLYQAIKAVFATSLYFTP